MLKKIHFTLSLVVALSASVSMLSSPAQAYGRKRAVAARIYCENPQDIAGDGYLVQMLELNVGPNTQGPMFEITGRIRLSSAFERNVATYASGEFTSVSVRLDIADIGLLEVRRLPNGTYRGTATFFSKPAATDLLCTVK